MYVRLCSSAEASLSNESSKVDHPLPLGEHIQTSPLAACFPPTLFKAICTPWAPTYTSIVRDPCSHMRNGRPTTRLDTACHLPTLGLRSDRSAWTCRHHRMPRRWAEGTGCRRLRFMASPNNICAWKLASVYLNHDPGVIGAQCLGKEGRPLVLPRDVLPSLRQPANFLPYRTTPFAVPPTLQIVHRRKRPQDIPRCPTPTWLSGAVASSADTLWMRWSRGARRP